MYLSETSDTVTKLGGDFKETLRELGGLDNIFDVMVNCHSELEVRFCLCILLLLKQYQTMLY
jgi:hypothetical protein